ncbi:hypothetical protein TYRP_016470 [Tyrophagus putrescentiae]|nr:hypothetical protein TYRP_016470 [Tyrophagus putrescentiae]
MSLSAFTRLFTSAGDLSASRTGPTLSTILTSMPSACGMTRMSEKMMAASRSKRRMGMRVASHASSGVRQMSKKLWCWRRLRNSGRYRPAWRITHTGTVGGRGLHTKASQPARLYSLLKRPSLSPSTGAQATAASASAPFVQRCSRGGGGGGGGEG